MKKRLLFLLMVAVIAVTGRYVPIAHAATGSFQFVGSTLPSGEVGNVYQTNISFIYSGDFSSDIVITLAGLPPGITLDPLGNQIQQEGAGLYYVTITGTVKQAGQYNVVAVLSDGNGASATQSYPLTMSTTSTAFNVTTTSLPSANGAAVYNESINFTYSGSGTLSATVSGLPTGLKASAPAPSAQGYTISLTGLTSQPGQYNLSVVISDGNQTASATIPLTVTAPPSATPTPTVQPSPTVPVPTPVSQQVYVTAHTAGTNVSSNGTVYMVTINDQLRPYTSAGAFLSYGFNSWSTVVPANSADLALPAGNFIPPRDGKIICSDKGSDMGTCYLITDSEKAAFTSASVFIGLGFSFSNTLSGDVSFLPSTANITSASQSHPAGVLINKSGTIYLVGDTGLLGVPDMSTLASWGYSTSDSVKANAADSTLVQVGIMPAHTAGALSPFAE